MIGPCICGDPACPSCGTAMGTYPEQPCRVCDEFVDDCECLECPVCGEIGDPECLGDHAKACYEFAEFVEAILAIEENEE